MTYVIVGTVVLLVLSGLIFLWLELKKQMTTGKWAQRRAVDLAMVQLTQQLRRNPNDAAAMTKLGSLKIRKGEIAAGVEDLRRALHLDSSQTEAHYQLGLVYYEKREFAAAAREFRWITENSEDPLYKTAVKEKYAQLKAKKYI